MQVRKDERNEIKSTSHSRYRCQYHIVLAPKNRRKGIYGQLKKRDRRNPAEIVQAKECRTTGSRGVCRSHTYAGAYLRVARFMDFFKGKSSLMIFDRHANLKYK